MKKILSFLCIIYVINIQTIPSFNAMVEVFDFWSSQYRELVKITDYNILNWLEDKNSFFPKTSQQVLDLGCADGFIGEYIYSIRPQYTFVGIDYSLKMVERCEQNGLYTQVIQADLSNGLPEQIKQESFDIVTAIGCLEFVQQHGNLFKEISCALKPQGLFWLTLWVDTDSQPHVALDTPLTHYTKDAAYELLTKCGFTVLDLARNDCAYKHSKTQECRAYFLIIAQKN